MAFQRTIGVFTLLGVFLCSTLVADDSLVFTIPKFETQAAVTLPTECRVPIGPTIPISAVRFSPDGKTLAVGGYGEVLLWDLENAKLDKRIGVGELTDLIHAVAFLDEGKQLAVGDGSPSQSCSVKIFEIESGDLVQTFDEPGDVVYTLAASPDGNLLAAGGADRKVYVWNTINNQLETTKDDYQDWVLGLAFSGDGKLLATGTADRVLQVWEVETWKSKQRFTTPEAVRAVVLNPTGTAVIGAIGGPRERAVRIGFLPSAAATGKKFTPKLRAVSTDPGLPLDLALNARLSRVLVGCTDHTIRALDARNGRLLATLKGHTGWVYAVALSPDSKMLASGSADGTVKLWNSADGRLMATLVQRDVGTERWLLMTPRGFFTASSADGLSWTAEDGSQLPSKRAASFFQNVERVQRAITPREPVIPEWKRRAMMKKRQAEAALRNKKNKLKNKN